jgi:hypothetical protein
MLSRDDKFEILKIELTLLQSRFDKYDGWILQIKKWFLTVWIGGIGFKSQFPLPMIIIISLPFLFWFLESLTRYCHWYKYVTRYRYIRDLVGFGDIENMNVYDLTNRKLSSELRKKYFKHHFRKSFFQEESCIFYTMFIILTVAILHLAKI